MVEYFVIMRNFFYVFLFAQNSFILRQQLAFLNILYNHKPNASYTSILQANANLKIILDWAFQFKLDAHLLWLELVTKSVLSSPVDSLNQ